MSHKHQQIQFFNSLIIDYCCHVISQKENKPKSTGKLKFIDQFINTLIQNMKTGMKEEGWRPEDKTVRQRREVGRGAP